jgi:hypothetical protein
LAQNLCEGTYNITVSDKNNCKNIFSTEIKNNGYKPPLNATADHYTLYRGQATTLHAHTTTNISFHDHKNDINALSIHNLNVTNVWRKNCNKSHIINILKRVIVIFAVRITIIFREVEEN